jgi:hypothetical protein
MGVIVPIDESGGSWPDDVEVTPPIGPDNATFGPWQVALPLAPGIGK